MDRLIWESGCGWSVAGADLLSWLSADYSSSFWFILIHFFIFFFYVQISKIQVRKKKKCHN